MKILIVVPYLYPALTYGGPAKVVFDLAVKLAKKHDVTIYTSDAWNGKRRISENEKLKSKNNFNVKYFRNLINGIAYKYRIFSAFVMVTSYLIEKDDYDIVHINDVFILPNLLIGFLAVLYKKPYVYSPHGVLDPVRIRKKFLLKKILYFLLARNVLGNAKTLIATSEVEKKVLNDLGFKRVVAVYNGVSTKRFVPTKKYRRFKNNNKFTMLYVGKIHALKGLKELISALKNIKFEYQLLIAGPDDGDLENLRNLISKYKLKDIYFLGFVDDNEKTELYDLSDLFVHPSLSEGFSISILEALNYGLPVLITKACNFPDVEKYKAGIVVNENNLTNELEKAISLADKQRNLLRDMGRNGAILLKKYYSIEEMARKITRIYEIHS